MSRKKSYILVINNNQIYQNQFILINVIHKMSNLCLHIKIKNNSENIFKILFVYKYIKTCQSMYTWQN